MKNLFFQNPGFLMGFVILGIPLFLHLINRKLPQKIVFSSIRFIQKAQQLHAGKKHIRDWLVLLCRLLLLSLIILLFASPEFVFENPIQGTQNRNIVLFYDVSASMNTSNFQDYVDQETKKIFDHYSKAKFALVVSSNKTELKIPFGLSREEILKKVKGISPGILRGDHHSGLSDAGQLFTENERSQNHLYIFSDLQKQDWIASKIPRLPSDLDIHFIKPPHSNGSNLCINRVIPEIFIKENIRTLRATVQVHNFSLLPGKALLRLSSGERSASLPIELSGDANEKFVLDLIRPDSNTAIAEIVTEESYLLDNQYFFWIGPKTPKKFAIMIDSQEDQEKNTEIFFLKNALSVSLPGTEKYEVQIISPEFVWNNPLTEFQCVFILDSISTFSEIEMETIQNYLSNKGNLVLFSGEKAAECMGKLNQLGVTSTRFLGFHGERNLFRTFSLSNFPEKSWVLLPFEKESGDLFNFPIYKFSKISPSPNSKVLIAIMDTYPFLLQENFENGNLFIFTTGLSTKWSEFPTSLTFVPLIHRIIEFVGLGEKQGVLEFTIGDNLAETFSKYGLPQDISITQSPGIQQIMNFPMEINVTRQESNLQSTEDFIVRSQLNPGKEYQNKPAGKEKKITAHVHPLHQPISWAILVILVAELILANQTKKGSHAFI